MTDTTFVAPRPAEAGTADDGPSWVARAWRAPLVVHLLVLGVVLLALIPLSRPTVATPDEGAYGIQARLVAEGRWAVPEPLGRFDPDGAHFPLTLSTQTADGQWFAYIKHPVVPFANALLLRAVGEDVGLRVLPLAGLLLAAAAAWLLAAELDRRRAPTAFWLAAASPLIFNAYIIWIHTMAAGVAGLALLVVVRAFRTGWTPWRWVALGAALASGVLLRSELVLLTVAILAVVAALRWRASGRLSAVLPAAVPAAMVGAAMAVERWWTGLIVSNEAPRDLTMRGKPGGPSVLVGRVEGAWRAALRGGGAELVDARSVLLPLIVVVATVVAVRYRGSAGRRVELALVGTGAALVLLWASAPGATVSGLIPAAPALAIGVGVAIAARVPSGGWPLLGPTVLFGAAVLATQYADGGGFQWGGRFLNPIIVPLAVVAAGGWHRLVADRPVARRGDTIAAVALLVAVGGLVPVAALGDIRSRVEPVYADVARHASAANVTTSTQLPRLMWREDLDWLIADRDTVGPLLRRMADGGVPEVTAVVPRTQAASTFEGWRIVDEEPLETVGLRIVVLRRP